MADEHVLRINGRYRPLVWTLISLSLQLSLFVWMGLKSKHHVICNRLSLYHGTFWFNDDSVNRGSDGWSDKGSPSLLTSTYTHNATAVTAGDGRSSLRVCVFVCLYMRKLLHVCSVWTVFSEALYPQLSAVANDWSQGGCWEEECRNWNRRLRPCHNVCGSWERSSAIHTREGEQTLKVMNINGEHGVSDEASTANLPCFQRAHITISAL